MIQNLSTQIFILIKENKFNNLEELINENNDIDLDIHDENYNYIIHLYEPTWISYYFHIIWNILQNNCSCAYNNIISNYNSLF